MQSARYLKSIGTLGLLALLGVACVQDPHYHGPPPQPRPAYYFPYGYYYYPSVQVYFHYSTGYYFYPRGKVWIRSRVLPRQFRLDPRDRVHLELKSNKPYLYHHQQLKNYQPPKGHKPVPEKDRHERETLRQWHQEQQEYKKQKRFEEQPRLKEKEQRRR